MKKTVEVDDDSDSDEYDANDIISLCIPDFLPVHESKSNIAPLPAFLYLTLHLPPPLRMREWELLFSIDRDGTSLQTFYRSLEDNDEAVILIQDDLDGIFGVFTSE